MSRKPRKPEGFKDFDSLARKLVQVPKAELDKQIAKTEKRKAKSKK